MRTSQGGRSLHQGMSTCCSPPHKTCQSAEHTLGPPTIDIFLASTGRSNKLTVSASSWQPETCWKLISFGPLSLQDKEHNIQRVKHILPTLLGESRVGDLCLLGTANFNGKTAEFCKARELGECSENHTSAFWHWTSTENHSLGTGFWKAFMLMMKAQVLTDGLS